MGHFPQAGRWARIRTAVAFFAATGVVLVCLSYRESEPNHSPPLSKNGDFFASLQPSEDDIDSPNGRRGFTLLQKAAATSLLQHMHTQAGATKPPVAAHHLSLDGLKFRAQRPQQVDFLSAGAARKQISHYWQALAHRTRVENGGDPQDAAAKLMTAPALASKGPLTAAEAQPVK